MIELKLQSGIQVLLSPIQKDANHFELVDDSNDVQMIVQIEKSHIKVIDYKNIDKNQDGLDEKLNQLTLSLVEANQSGIEENEIDLPKEISPYDPDLIRVHQKQFSIKFIEEMINNGDIDLAPDFQRNFVWNSMQQSRLIESLLLRIPLPMFYFAEDSEGRLTIVDGLQRLTTINAFMHNQFPLRHLEYLDEGVKGRYYKTDREKGQIGIDPKYYRWFNMTQFAVNVIDPTSPTKVKYDIFRRINTGAKPLKNQEIRNCLSSSSLRNLLKEMANLKEFKSATDNSISSTRMEDLEIALRFIVFFDAFTKDPTLKTSYHGYMETFLDEATDTYFKVNNPTHCKFVSLFQNAMKNAEHLFGRKYAFRKILKEHIGEDTRKQLFNKALFVAWSVCLANIPFEDISRFPKKYLLKILSKSLEEDKNLMFFLSYGTNGKANLEYIFQTTRKIINTHLKYEI